MDDPDEWDEQEDGAVDEEWLALELADGSRDPDEVPSHLEPWDEGADDEL